MFFQLKKFVAYFVGKDSRWTGIMLKKQTLIRKNSITYWVLAWSQSARFSHIDMPTSICRSRAENWIDIWVNDGY